MKVVTVVILLISAVVADYCNSTLCGSKTHIGCKNNGKLSSTCPADAKIFNIKSYKKLIIDEHNKYRNMVASGKLRGFEPAVRMRALTWSQELANLAELNLKRCKYGHDECRSTNTFLHAGQNLGTTRSTRVINAKEFIKNHIANWFNEYKIARMSDIREYAKTKRKIGHFTAMVVDRTTKIGCAVIQYTENENNRMILACNYASTNLIGLPIYKSGKTASKCTKGRSSKYSSLCADSEPINPNKL